VLRFAAFLPLLLLLPACRGVYAPDVAERFEQDFREVRLRIPDKADLNPARAAAGAMAGTVAIGRRYLDGDPGTSMHTRYVRALLACAHLIRGETTEAHAVMHGIKPHRNIGLAHENRVINATIYAVSVCRSLSAREVLVDLFEGSPDVSAFVARYGSFFAIQLPDPTAPAYREMLGTAIARLRADCFMEVSGDPIEMETVHKQRAAMRRIVGEQVYNDAASLLVTLPSGESAETEWLGYVGVSTFVSYGKIFNEIVPMSLGPRQKQWQLEQADGLFRTVRKRAALLKGRAIYRELAPHIRNAEIEIRGWIETR